MFNRLFDLYPNAIYSEKPTFDSQLIWFKDNETDTYIGIPRSDLTEKEKVLLHTLFPIEDVGKTPTLTPLASEWLDFLKFNGALPKSKSKKVRLIHFTISNIRDEFQFDEWAEAINSLFTEEVIIVPISVHNGVIVEEKSPFSITEEELFSAIQAFESDFFVKNHFFIGQFQRVDSTLVQLYQMEEILLKLSLTEHPEGRIFTREKLIPAYLYQQLPETERNILFADVHRLLADDHDLATTIKTYIENQSNATLTAKQLFMHRNSLQYRIDKFIEKTGIDIKTFHGAFFAYLACLHLPEN